MVKIFSIFFLFFVPNNCHKHLGYPRLFDILVEKICKIKANINCINIFNFHYNFITIEYTIPLHWILWMFSLELLFFTYFSIFFLIFLKCFFFHNLLNDMLLVMNNHFYIDLPLILFYFVSFLRIITTKYFNKLWTKVVSLDFFFLYCYIFFFNNIDTICIYCRVTIRGGP